MKIRTFILLWMLVLPAHADQDADTRAVAVHPHPGVVIPTFPSAPRSWLGLDLSKPDPSLIAHLPSLPPGVGFLLKSVHANGPAANAGLQEADLIWKLNEQLLVNEAQLSTLLRLHQPGEAVTLSVFRGGSQLEIPVTLGASPLPVPEFAGQAAEEAVFLSEQGPMRVVNLAEREAFIANAEGRATVRKVGDGYWLTIQNAEGDVIFDDRFDRGTSQHELTDAIPTEWKRRAYALRRGLDHALEGRMAPQRQPRPRVVPPPPSP
ncbi:MAG: PDZ domain-containing protein [Luteolibacter sp.]|jgi:hypothetical protein